MSEQDALLPILSKVRNLEEKAILAASTELIRDSNGKFVLASYYGVLFSSLQTCIGQVRVVFLNVLTPQVKAFQDTSKKTPKQRSEEELLAKRCSAISRLLYLVSQQFVSCCHPF